MPADHLIVTYRVHAGDRGRPWGGRAPAASRHAGWACLPPRAL